MMKQSFESTSLMAELKMVSNNAYMFCFKPMGVLSPEISERFRNIVEIIAAQLA